MRFIKNLLDFITINRSGLFDPGYYISSYPDVQRTYKNPIMHYIKMGWTEGRNPSANFNTIYYLRENKDVRHARTNPLVHFIKFGQAL